MSSIKRCGCDEARWPKCTQHPWYMKQFRYNGKPYAPNLTRYATEVLGKTDWKNTKTEADALGDDVRSAIRNGTYVDAKTKKNTVPERKPDGKKRERMTAATTRFGDEVVDKDTEKNKQTRTGDKSALRRLCALKVTRETVSVPIGELWVDDVQTADLIAFRTSPAIAILANSTWAKFRTTFGQFFAWAVDEALTLRSPLVGLANHKKKALKRGDFARRDRRLDDGEYAKLRRAATKTRADDATALRVEGMIVCAYEAALRHGECLALQWAHVDIERRRLFVAALEQGARKTGEGKSRWVPMSDALAVELIALQNDPTGKPWPKSAYVFGDATGGRVKSIKKAWATLVLRAHGFEPKWNGTKLSPISRRQLAKIDREFKDLRRECALRWYEVDGWDILEVRDALGHASVTTTEIYLNVPKKTAFDAMRAADERRRQQREQQRQQQAAGGGGMGSGSNAHKRHTNASPSDRGVNGPRLVKSDNSRSGV